MVAKSSSARKDVPSTPGPEPRSSGQDVQRSLRDLERLIHEPTRLGIISALAANEVLSFSELKTILQTSDGNLSVHARKLEDAGYLLCRKGFEGRVPRTEYRLSSAGKRALEKYLNHMQAIIHATRQT